MNIVVRKKSVGVSLTSWFRRPPQERATTADRGGGAFPARALEPAVPGAPLSVNNGHVIIPDMAGTVAAQDIDLCLSHLRGLPFIRRVDLTQDPAAKESQTDGLLKLKTPRGTFTLALEAKRTFLDRALTNSLIGQHKRLLHRTRTPLFLAARYIPRPTGERLAQAGVNFVDRPGNIHLRLGDEYHVLILGRRDAVREVTSRRLGPSLVQVLFVLLVQPEAAAWPIRKLADAAGTGKSAAASARERLVRLGVLARGEDQSYRVVDRRRLIDDFLTGYAQVLRPHLLLGRFRAPEKDPGAMLKAFARTSKEMKLGWAVTGGPAAFLLDRFHRGDKLPVFVDSVAPDFQRKLRLVNDRRGPMVLLRPFGRLWCWRTVGRIPVAHPWLIYAELIHDGQPRALESAEQIRDKYLAP